MYPYPNLTPPTGPVAGVGGQPVYHHIPQQQQQPQIPAPQIAIPTYFPQLQEMSFGQLTELANDDGPLLDDFIGKIDGVSQMKARLLEMENAAKTAAAEVQTKTDEKTALEISIGDLELQLSSLSKETAEKAGKVNEMKKKYDKAVLLGKLQMITAEMDRKSEAVVDDLIDEEKEFSGDISKFLIQHKEARKQVHLHQILQKQLEKMALDS